MTLDYLQKQLKVLNLEYNDVLSEYEKFQQQHQEKVANLQKWYKEIDDLEPSEQKEILLKQYFDKQYTINNEFINMIGKMETIDNAVRKVEHIIKELYGCEVKDGDL